MIEFDAGFQVCNVVGERKDADEMEPKRKEKKEANSGFKCIRANRIKNVRMKICKKRHKDWGESMV